MITRISYVYNKLASSATAWLGRSPPDAAGAGKFSAASSPDCLLLLDCDPALGPAALAALLCTGGVTARATALGAGASMARPLAGGSLGLVTPGWLRPVAADRAAPASLLLIATWGSLGFCSLQPPQQRRQRSMHFRGFAVGNEFLIDPLFCYLQRV